MKKKLLIVTLNDYIIYQPTILNLYDALAPHFDTTIISFEPEYISNKKDESRNIIYLKTNFLWREFFQKTDFIISKVLKLAKSVLPGVKYHYLYYIYYFPTDLKRKVKTLAPAI